MAELALTRSVDDRRRYELDGVGSIRRVGLFSRGAELHTVTGRMLNARSRGFAGRTSDATDEASGTVGQFVQAWKLKRTGTLTWRGLPHEVTTESSWRNRYLLSRDGRALLTVQCRGWGRTPARLTVHDDTLDPGLALFTTWLVQQFVESDAAAAS